MGQPANPQSVQPGSLALPQIGLNPLWRAGQYFLGVILYPTSTFEHLVREQNMLVAAAPVLVYFVLTLLHNLVRVVLLSLQTGVQTLLSEPAFVGGFGNLRLSQGDYWQGWGTAFIILGIPLTWILLAAVAQVMGRLAGGHGSFESGLATLSYACFIPWILIQSTSEILFSLPLNFITGAENFSASAMAGEFGPIVALFWNTFIIGIYWITTYTWSLVLITIAVRQNHRLAFLPAFMTALGSLLLAIFFFSTYIR